MGDPAHLELLADGEMEILGRMPWSSNGTFLVELELADRGGRAIYKPLKGERPLWDFPEGLYQREVGFYELSDQLGWGVVPETVLRDGPLGIGSLQRFVDADFEQHYFTIQDDPSYRPAIEKLCVLDIVANNTDRKSGHCLVCPDGEILGIDHGLSFHVEFKLRTVLWDYAGEDIPGSLLDDVESFVDNGPSDALLDLLNEEEIDAMSQRARSVLINRKFPTDPTGRRWPWPLV